MPMQFSWHPKERVWRARRRVCPALPQRHQALQSTAPQLALTCPRGSLLLLRQCRPRLHPTTPPLPFPWTPCSMPPPVLALWRRTARMTPFLLLLLLPPLRLLCHQLLLCRRPQFQLPLP